MNVEKLNQACFLILLVRAVYILLMSTFSNWYSFAWV
jgi:hypothetical protein